MKIIRLILGFLLAFAALNAFGGGYYAMSGAEGVPVEWLEGSPFKSYFIPGLILFTIVGGCFLFAAISVFSFSRSGRNASFLSVGIVFTWLAVQVALIGYVSWMQPVTAVVSVVIFICAWLLPAQRIKN